MDQLDTTAIIIEAQKMRADEMLRIQKQLAKRLDQYLGLLADSATASRPLLTRVSLALRELFSWNPQAHRG